MSCSTSFCRALSASQGYRAETLRYIRDPLLGYRKLPWSQQKVGVFCLTFHVSFPGFGVVWISTVDDGVECLYPDSWRISWISLFQDRTQSTKVPIAGQLSSSHILQIIWCMQLIASSLIQLSREAVGPYSLVVFESLYRNSDLVISGRRRRRLVPFRCLP